MEGREGRAVTMALMTNDVKCRDTDYIDFLIASPRLFSCTEAAKVQPESLDPPAHDAFTRLLRRLEPDPETLWQEARPLVHRKGGMLVLDDSTLDKPYAKAIDLVTRHWSGKHHDVVLGINLTTLLWTDGDRHIPCDYRLYDKARDGLSKNDHFAAMLGTAHERGIAPDCVAFDGWYSGLENLKLIRSLGWHWLTRLKINRRVNLNRQGNKAVGDTAIEPGGTVVHLEGYGLIRVFRIVSRDGDTEHWATDDLAMDELTRLGQAEQTWAIENYHRGLKQCCGVERCQARSERAQRNHIGMAIRAFLRLERHFYATGVSWYEAKARIIRGAIRAYIAHPLYGLA
jgi:putative transposase